MNRERSLRDQNESRINCQLSNLPTSSLVSSDVEYVPNWTIYNKLDSKECSTAILLNDGPKSSEYGKNYICTKERCGSTIQIYSILNMYFMVFIYI